MAGGQVGRVVIAIPTYRRIEELADLLPQVIEQLADQTAATGLDIGVVVIDNDARASARPVVERLSHDKVRYVVEAKPGIAAVRNRALREALDADALIFIDDDERPRPRWLESLLATYRSTGAQAVAGAVISAFPAPLDEWLAAGDFFRRRRLTTGSRIDVAATNNLLLDLETVRRLGLTFDERFGRTGGSDTMFTRSLVAAGGRMIWCDEAIVVDRVPVERMTRRWVLLRALRSGNSWSRTSVALAGSRLDRFRARAGLTARGSVRVFGGAARHLLGTVTRSPAHRARGLRTLARGAGMISGAFGHRYQEYRRDGS